MRNKEVLERWKEILLDNKNAIENGEKARVERENLIVKAAEEGVSKTDIHRVTGISRTAIYNIINKHSK